MSHLAAGAATCITAVITSCNGLLIVCMHSSVCWLPL